MFNGLTSSACFSFALREFNCTCRSICNIAGYQRVTMKGYTCRRKRTMVTNTKSTSSSTDAPPARSTSNTRLPSGKSDRELDFEIRSLVSENTSMMGVGDSHFRVSDSDASQISKPSYLQYKFLQVLKITGVVRSLHSTHCLGQLCL